MMKRLACAVAAVGLIASSCFLHLPIFAESKDGNSVIDLNTSEDCETDSESLEDISSVPIVVYELGDPRVPAAGENNAVVHDLNTSKDCETDLESLEDISNVPIIIYELGDPRVPVSDCDTMDNVNILEESVTRGDLSPTSFYNLAVGAYDFSFSNVKNHVYTNAYFSTNANGYISISTGGIKNSVRISVLEYDTDKVVGTWAGDPQSIAGFGFQGDSSKFYYYKFEPYNVTSVSGSGQIFWDN